MEILLGHLFGDYMFQSKPMALQKSKKGIKGFGWCLLHSLLYTFGIYVFFRDKPWYIYVTIAVTHFLIDRYRYGLKWLYLINGRDYTKLPEMGIWYETEITFNCLVYTVVDNTLHLLVLWWLLAQPLAG